MNSVCFNGTLLSRDAPVLNADNKSYRYGDGLFETMKMVRGQIPLAALHFERLFSSLRILGYNIPSQITVEKFQQEILILCSKNNCEKLARVRLSVSRGNGGIYDETDELQYLVECWPITEANSLFNENGYIIDVFPVARKSCDAFSNLKSANYLPYVMAARYAKANKLDDCLMLNVHDRIADASVANIFIVKNGKLFTPSLSEGGINGVMRRYLLEEIGGEEIMVSIEDLLSADEIFLTNAINGIRWVKEFRSNKYDNRLAAKIQEDLYKTIWR